ncbi:MAG: hypothetical protein N3A71_00020 [Candidatus Dojkabacteria bacterium]|nr:hypothetical protein [Candidatus Dojkabacteria bacterium]
MLAGNLSQRQLKMLNIPVADFLNWIKILNFSEIRMGLYWDEIESKPGIFVFDSILSILDFFELNNINVTICLGLKSPRIPEFYPPFWLRNPYEFENNKKYLFHYLKKSIDILKKYKCIKKWQIENEPLDPSPPHWKTIPIEILVEEIRLFRKNNISNICINFWGNELVKRNQYMGILEDIDIIGLNFYFEMYDRRKNKIENIFTIDKCLKTINFIKEKYPQKDIIITEFQFEPWIIGNPINNFLPMYEKLMRKYPRIFYYITDFIAKGAEKYIDFDNIIQYYEKISSLISIQKIYLWGLEYIYTNKKDTIILNLLARLENNLQKI